MTFRLSALMSAAAAVLALAAPGAHAAASVLNFDDLSGLTPGNSGNWTYKGFTFEYNNGPRVANCAYCFGSWYWSDVQSPNFPTFDQPWYKSASTSISTDYFAFPDGNPQSANWPFDSTNWGESLGIKRATPFYFDGAYMIALDDKSVLSFNGYLGGVLVGQSAAITLNYNDGGTYLVSGFGDKPVDEIRVQGRQGFFAMDDFTYDVVPIPEPSTYLMMIAGLAGVGALARRKAKQA